MHRRQAVGFLRSLQQSGAAEIVGQAQRDAGATRHERAIQERGARRKKIVVPHRAENCVTATLSAQPREVGAHGFGAAVHRRERHKTDFMRSPAGKDAAQIGIAHRGQRMVLHTGFRKQHVADEEIPFSGKAGQKTVKSASSASSSASATGPILPASVEFEGGAVFEEELPRVGADQPSERR